MDALEKLVLEVIYKAGKRFKVADIGIQFIDINCIYLAKYLPIHFKNNIAFLKSLYFSVYLSLASKSGIVALVFVVKINVVFRFSSSWLD